MAWREPLPAFGHPPLRGEGQGDQRGHLAPLLALPLAPLPLRGGAGGEGGRQPPTPSTPTLSPVSPPPPPRGGPNLRKAMPLLCQAIAKFGSRASARSKVTSASAERLSLLSALPLLFQSRASFGSTPAHKRPAPRRNGEVVERVALVVPSVGVLRVEGESAVVGVQRLVVTHEVAERSTLVAPDLGEVRVEGESAVVGVQRLVAALEAVELRFAACAAQYENVTQVGPRLERVRGNWAARSKSSSALVCLS